MEELERSAKQKWSKLVQICYWKKPAGSYVLLLLRRSIAGECG